MAAFEVGLDRALHDAPFAHAELVALALFVGRLHGALENVVAQRLVIGACWPVPGVLRISTSRPSSRKKPSSRATSSGRSWMAFIIEDLTFFSVAVAIASPQFLAACRLAKSFTFVQSAARETSEPERVLMLSRSESPRPPHRDGLHSPSQRLNTYRERHAAMAELKLKTVTRTQGNNQALKDGSVKPRTFAFEFEEIPVLIDGFRRMVRGLEFDICEMAITTYICARAHGKRFTALPIFLVRAFHHGAIIYNTKAGIGSPKDLEGRKVGVNRGYTVTTGVWARSVLQDEYGVDLNKIPWVSGDEHVAEYRRPPMSFRSSR